MSAEAVPLPPEEDEKLVAEADRLELTDVDRETWFRTSPRQRNLIKGKRHRVLKAEARRLGLDPENFVIMSADERREARSRAESDHDSKLRGLADKHKTPEDEVPPPKASAAHSTGDRVPATDPLPSRRQAPTVGPIEERIEDLAGDRPPRTLADVYARWPLLGRSGGEDFYLRVERAYPKKWGGIDVAGYLGEIRDVVCNEEQFGKFFGKGEYQLQLYGPDPKGRRDQEGNRLIKALTDVFTITVPDVYGPPRLVPLPKRKPLHRPQEDTMFNNPMNPFGAPVFPAVPTPTTSADAQVHRTSLDFAARLMDQRSRDLDERERRAHRDDGGTPKHVFDFLGTTTKAQVDAARHDADARERLLRLQLERGEKENEKLRDELREFKREVENARASASGDALEIAKLRDGDAQRLHEHYRNQIDNAQRSHDAQLKSLKEAHEAEVKRERDRFQEQQTYYDRQLAEERRRAQDREKDLKDELDRIRREERDASDKRIEEEKRRADERLKDQEQSHQRELRTMKETYESRVDTTKTKLEFELSHARERLEDARADAAKAKEEADRAKDPVAAVKEFEEKAKQLGMEKPNPAEPKNMWERFAAAAGTGVGQALANTDLTTLVGALRGAVARGAPGTQQMQPGQAPAQQLPPGRRPQQRGPSARAMRWAADGAQIPSPTPQPQPVQVPQTMPQPRPVQPAQPEPQAQQPQPAQSSQQPAQSSQPQAAPSQQPGQPSQPPPGAVQIELPPHRLREVFGDQGILGFIQNVEGAINSSFSPKEFAELFINQYRPQAERLAREFGPDDSVEFVKAIPQAIGSPVLRRDGKKWLESLWEAMRDKLKTGQAAPGPTT